MYRLLPKLPSSPPILSRSVGHIVTDTVGGKDTSVEVQVCYRSRVRSFGLEYMMLINFLMPE